MKEEEAAKNFIKNFLHKEEVKETVVEKPVDAFQDMPIAMLPFKRLYHPNLRLEMRPLDVGEIANYSTLESNDSNAVRTKLDEIMEKCIKVSMPPRTKKSYKSLFVHDRLYIIYTLREMTFQNGRVLSNPIKCNNPNCLHDFDIELVRQNIELWNEDEEVWQYYKPQNGCFVFETTFQEEPFFLRPPTIGLQQSFYYWQNDMKFKNKEINAAFVKIAPYMLNTDELSNEELTELHDNFLNQFKTETGELAFQFLNDAVDRFKNNDFHIGVRGLMKRCPRCGSEVRTKTVFPRRARDLFVVPNAFGNYIKK